MTQDVIALTPQMPDTRTLLAGLHAGGPDLLVNRAGDGSVAQLCTAAGQVLVSVEAPWADAGHGDGPNSSDAMEFASDFQSRGVKDLAFEDKRKPEGLDLDVLVKSGDKITYGCQLKVVGKEHSIGSAARKIANDQLSGRIAGPKVAILDIHSTKSALTEATIRDVEHYAKKTGATFELRFKDGSITFPANGRIYP
ncbi:hypothetical protein [Streptomyces sp. NPDC057496]|uniref:hypothetical protein n=1 Tax=Streptomyces sp. NPDC057496 TaxID=3346149 RepID=UPI0036AD38EA